MTLYLLRHADAEEVRTSDSARPLPAKASNAQAKRVFAVRSKVTLRDGRAPMRALMADEGDVLTSGSSFAAPSQFPSGWQCPAASSPVTVAGAVPGSHWLPCIPSELSFTFVLRSDPFAVDLPQLAATAR